MTARKMNAAVLRTTVVLRKSPLVEAFMLRFRYQRMEGSSQKSKLLSPLSLGLNEDEDEEEEAYERECESECFLVFGDNNRIC